MKYTLFNEETDRLRFRKLDKQDFTDWKIIFEDRQVVKMFGMEEYETTEECCEKWFEWTFNRYENDLGGHNVLVDKITKNLIGQTGLLVREIENNFEIEVAYSILPNYRKRGFAKEAAQKCINLAFENNFHNRLISLIHEENINSQNVVEKLGMTYEKDIVYNEKKFRLYQINKENFITRNKK